MAAMLIALIYFYYGRPEQGDYQQLDYGDLSGWSEDQHDAALKTFIKSCEKENIGLPKWPFLCEEARRIGQKTPDGLREAARLFFEKNFTPLAFRQKEAGLFTGYFAPEYEGSHERTDEFIYPLYSAPPDMQRLDLGLFDQSLAGRTIVGRVRDGKFMPYNDRKAIDQGALMDKGLELVWLKDPADAFFLHIQGSGRIFFEDGSHVLLGYAGKNGHAYHAVGRTLIEKGEISAQEMSMQAIRRWMGDNPDQVQDLMWQNPSYIFFRKMADQAPIGTLGVGLTPGRSVAVDPEYIPLGLPLWLDIKSAEAPIRRLVMAQDTGGAIKGRIRADLYWGIGQEAAEKAGPMKEKGRLYMLAPHELAATLLNSNADDAREAR